MTDAELDALDRLCQEVEGKATVGEADYLPSAGGHHVLFSHAEYRLYMAARTALPQLVAEVRRLRALDICEVCRCRLEHPQPCHCWNDE